MFINFEPKKYNYLWFMKMEFVNIREIKKPHAIAWDF